MIYFGLKPKKTKLKHQEEKRSYFKKVLICRRDNQLNIKPTSYSHLIPAHITNFKMPANCSAFFFLHIMDTRDNDIWILLQTKCFSKFIVTKSQAWNLLNWLVFIVLKRQMGLCNHVLTTTMSKHASEKPISIQIKYIQES